MQTETIDAPQLVDSSKSSPSEQVAGDNLTRLVLIRAGRVKGDEPAPVITAEYAKLKAEQKNAAELAEAERKRDLDEISRAKPLRAQLATLGLYRPGMTVAVMEKVLAEDGPAAQVAVDAKARAAAAEQRKRSVAVIFAKAGCPLRHTIDLERVEQAAGSNCPQWISIRDLLVNQAGYANGYLIALLGPRGVGKTELATSVIKHCCDRLLTCRYVKAADLFRDVRRSYAQAGRGEKGLTEAEIIDGWIKPDVLVIDECHQRGETDAEQNLLTNLLDRRYDDMRCTVVIANQTKEEFAAALGDSVVSRIHQTGDAIICNWPSFRRQGEWRQPSDAPRRTPSGVIQQPRVDN